MIPQAIGGNLSPTNPFKTSDVCARCNNLCGLLVDTGFIKSWFTQADRSQEVRRHQVFEEGSIFPFTYMGVIPDLAYEGKICELWLGPTGDTTYHFHEPYPEVKDMPVLVGAAPNVRDEIDFGFVFIFVVPSNPVWWLPILRSLAVNFRGSDLYFANGTAPAGGLFSEIPAELHDLHTRLMGMRGVQHHARLSMTVGSEIRFLAKLALGVGHLFLDPMFSFSNDADLLRSMLWERSSERREEIPVRGTGFFGGNDNMMKQLLSWPRGHIIALLPTPKGVAMYARFYDHQEATILVSATQDHWRNAVPEGGIAFVVSPSLRKFVGPISIPQFVAHRQGLSINGELAALEDEVQRVFVMPPVHIDGAELV